MNNIRITVSDVIKDTDIAAWTPQEIIIISAGTGAGKSYFVKNKLYEFAKSENKKILFFIHRSNCTDQFVDEIKKDNKNDIINILTYQKIENDILTYQKHIDFSEYGYIVCDEFHYFISDAQFNATTDVSLEEIMQQENCIRIFMSATGEDIKRYIESTTKLEIHHYSVPHSYKYIQDLTFFSSNQDIESLCKQIINKNEKGIIFLQSAQSAYELYLKLKDNAIFNCSKSNSLYKHVNKDTIASMLSNECFIANLLITTSCMDAGVNIRDRQLKTIIADIRDIGSLIQCVGRKRIIDDTDTLDNLYIKNIGNQQLAGMIRRYTAELEKADYLLSHTTKEYLQKYPRQNDELVYFTTNGNKAVAQVNEMRYTKKINDIALFNNILSKPHGYCTYIANLFEFTNFGYYYSDNKLKDFLESIVDAPMLTPKDREPLIQKMNIKRNGRTIKGYRTLQGALEDARLPYFISQYSQYVTINGKRKRYKNIWEVKRK